MLNLTFDPLTGKLTLVSPVPLKATSQVPVTVTFTSAVSSATGLSLALGSSETPQRTLAFIDSFTTVSSTVRTAVLNAADTRMAAFMVGRGFATLDIEFSGIINGNLWIVHNVDVKVEAGVVTGPETTDGGPTYYTAGQVDDAIDVAIGLGGAAAAQAFAIQRANHTGFQSASTINSGVFASARLPANVAAVADNTSTTLNLGNVTLTLAGVSTTPLPAANLTGTVIAARVAGISPTFGTLSFTSSGNTPSISAGHGSGGAQYELGFILGQSGQNVGFFQNTNSAGFSGFAIRDENGNEKAAMCFGNSTSGGVFQGWLYNEISDATLGGNAPGYAIIQSTTYAGALSYGIHPRIGLLPTGELVVMPRAFNTAPNTGVSLLALDHSAPILTLGTGNNDGNSYGEIRGADGNNSWVLREGQTNKNSGYCYGGTLAGGLGWKFFTGGLKADQTLKFQIADDGVKSLVTLTAPTFTLSGGSVPTISTVTGDPEGAVTAPVSSLRLASGLSGKVYAKMTGSGNTGWTSLVTAADLIDGSISQLVLGTQLILGGTSGPKVLSGTGTPEAAITAGVGSAFLRTDSTLAAYLKESGAGNTGWSVIITASRLLSAIGTLGVANGGTGNATLATYGVLCGGTTGTGAVQSVAVGTSGQVLTSNGAGVLPSMQTPVGNGYTMTLTASGTGFDPADSTTYYVGPDLNDSSGTATTYTNMRVEIPKSGTIKRFSLKLRCVAGSSETVNHFIRLNDTTDVGSINTSYDAATREGVSAGLAQAVIAGDFIALKIATPAWATNPTACRWQAIVYIE